MSDAEGKWESKFARSRDERTCPQRLGITGEDNEFFWHVVPGYTARQFVEEVQDVITQTYDAWSNQRFPSTFPDWILFMSTVNEISRLEKRRKSKRVFQILVKFQTMFATSMMDLCALSVLGLQWHGYTIYYLRIQTPRVDGTSSPRA